MDNKELAYALKYEFTASNNESKYEALIAGLRMALAMNMEQLIICGDYKVVFGHVTGSLKAKEDNMRKYSTLVKSLIKGFATTWFKKINRKHNRKADELSKVIEGERISGGMAGAFIAEKH